MIASRGKPSWIAILPPQTEKFSELKKILRSHKLNTVCEEAHCPNIPECWSGGTATFMIMGKICSRGCRFCEIPSGIPTPLDPKEPENLAGAIAELGLDYVVVTSVDRDELPDQGAEHFACCIREIKSRAGILVEVLIPDFRGDFSLVQKIIDARPEVIAHNIETVERLQSIARDRRAGYKQSLSVLEFVKKVSPKIFTKSSIMLGLGEKDEEVVKAMRDLRAIGCDILTLGQYLRPSAWALPVSDYVRPEKFEELKKIGEELGFRFVAAGPFVRSSYRAGELFVKNILSKQTLV